MYVDVFWFTSFVGRFFSVLCAGFRGCCWGSGLRHSDRWRLYDSSLLPSHFFCFLEFRMSLFDYGGVVVVFWSLLIDGKSLACGDVAVEVVTCWAYCDPVVVDRVLCRPPKFYPATTSSIESYGVITLCSWSFCVISNGFFPGYSTSLYCPPPDTSYQVL
jgi:hypothetical protein